MTMEAQIRYARTTDGVGIAYTCEGAGPPFIMVPNLWSNIALFQRTLQHVMAALMRDSMAILIDGRGTGASQRAVGEVSLETRVLDLEAVIQDLGLPPVTLLGISHGGPAAIAYAARHPERVQALILASTYANGAAYYQLAPVMRAMAAIENMALDQWEFYTRTAANAVIGYSDPELAERMAQTYRDSITPEMLVRYREASRATDVRDLLGSIRCPTLVVDNRGSPLAVPELLQELASGIPGAQLASPEGNIFLTGETMQPIDAFLGRSPRPPAATQAATAQTATAVILFTDIADSTALTERMGDAGFRDASRALDSGLRSAIRHAGGQVVEGKVLGDGVMGVFPSAAQAIDGARRCHALSAASELGLHIGLHAGDVIREAGSVYGGAVNIASRICALSAPGEILVSDVVRGMARTSAGAAFQDHGEHEMKGVGDPVRVYAVRWREEAP